MRTTPVLPLRPLIVGWLVVGCYCLAVGLGPALLAGGAVPGESLLTGVEVSVSPAADAGVALADLAAPGR